MPKQTAETIQTSKLSMNGDFKAFNESSIPQEGRSEILEKDPFAGYRKGDQWSREYEMDDEEDEVLLMEEGRIGTAEVSDGDEAENRMASSNEDKSAEEDSTNSNQTDEYTTMGDTPPTTVTGVDQMYAQSDMQQDGELGAYEELANNNTDDTTGAGFGIGIPDEVQSEQDEESESDDSTIMMEAEIECCRILEEREQGYTSIGEEGCPDIELGTSCGEKYALLRDIHQLGYQYTYTPYLPYMFISPTESELPRKKKKKKIATSLPNKEDCVEPPEVRDLMSICSDESWELARSIYTNEDHVQELCTRIGSNSDPEDIPAMLVYNRPVPEFPVDKAEAAPYQSGDGEHTKAHKKFSWLRFFHKNSGPEIAPAVDPPKEIHFSHEKRTLSFNGKEEWKEFQSNAERSNSNPEPFEPVPIPSAKPADAQGDAKKKVKLDNASATSGSCKLRSCFNKLRVILKVGEKRTKEHKKKHFKRFRQLIHGFHWSGKPKEVVPEEASKGQKVLRSCLKVRKNPNIEQETTRANNCDTVDAYYKFRFENIYRNELDRHEGSVRKYRRQQLLEFYDQVCQESENSVPNG